MLEERQENVIMLSADRTLEILPRSFHTESRTIDIPDWPGGANQTDPMKPDRWPISQIQGHGGVSMQSQDHGSFEFTTYSE